VSFVYPPSAAQQPNDVSVSPQSSIRIAITCDTVVTRKWRHRPVCPEGTTRGLVARAVLEALNRDVQPVGSVGGIRAHVVTADWQRTDIDGRDQ
jgi:hypothetical protein